MRVLIVSFSYPPFSSITGLRVSKVSRYLFEQGWDVRVLCARHDDLPTDLPLELPTERVTRTGVFDVNALPKFILGRSHVARRGFEFKGEGLMTRLGKLYRNLFNFPDGQIGWFPGAVRAGTEMIRHARPQVILGVGTPWTSHLVAAELSRRSQIPWIAEYHDPWTDSQSRGRMWPVRPLERGLEDRVASSATMIFTASDAWRDQMARRFPLVPVVTVPFGFEPTDYRPVSPRSGLPLVLGYTGRLYERQDPGKLFGAVRSLLDIGRLSSSEIRLRFTGRYLEVARRALDAHALPDDVVKIEDPLRHVDAVAFQQTTTALVLFLGEDDDIGWRPAKLYEYLGAGRPVLVIGGTERHEALEILRRARVATWARATEQVTAVISKWADELRNSGTLEITPDTAVVSAFEWQRIAARTGELLRETVQLGRPGP